VGNREDLLGGAKRCLYEKGYARTTARDISAASGVSLAAIGYHFGSKEALLNAALFEAISEWGDELALSLRSEVDPDAEPLERFEATWTRAIDSFTRHGRLWAATFELAAQSDQMPEMRRLLADWMQHGRSGLVSLFHNLDEQAVDGHLVRTVGSFYQALMSGVLVQWLVDPQSAPSGRELADAVRSIAAGKGSLDDKRDS
jgi:AcrR family transcriptional regulator